MKNKTNKITKRKLIKKVLSDDVFLVDVIALSCDREQAQKSLDKLGIEYTLHGDGGCFVIPKSLGFVVWLSDPRDFYVLLHETVHLVNFILESKGINVNLANEEEVFAYYQSFWFRKLWRFFGNVKDEK